MKVQVRVLAGAQCRAAVNAFYERHGGQTRASDTDLFFIADDGSDSEASIKGAFRFCTEEGIPMLRSMLVDQNSRHEGVACVLLDAFAAYLNEKKITGVHCLPFSHLEKLYERIGFHRIDQPAMPGFLVLRMKGYFAQGNPCICMKR